MVDITFDISKEINKARIINPTFPKINILNTNIDAIKNSIKNILMTSKGEVPGFPDFGANIGSLLFELMTPATMLLLKKLIKEALEENEPRISINDVEVKINKEYHSILANIKFTYMDFTGTILNDNLTIKLTS